MRAEVTETQRQRQIERERQELKTAHTGARAGKTNPKLSF